MKENIIKYTALGLCSLAVFSCATTQKYERPELPLADSYYVEEIYDTANISNLYWPDFFADSDLNLLIQQALDNNLELKAAESRINTAALPKAQKAHRDAVQTRLIANVATAYHKLVGLDAKLEALNGVVERMQQNLDVVKSLKESGQSNQLAVNMTSAGLLETRSRIPEIEKQIILTENHMAFLLGEAPAGISRKDMYENVESSDILRIGTPEHLIENRPDVREAEYRLMSAAGKSDKEAAEYVYKNAVLNAQNEVSDAIARFSSTKTSMEYQRLQVKELSSSVDMALLLFKSDYATYLDLLAAQQQTLEAQLKLIDLYFENSTARIELYRALGGGWQE